MKYKMISGTLYLSNELGIFRRVHDERLLKAPPQDEVEPQDSVSKLE